MQPMIALPPIDSFGQGGERVIDDHPTLSLAEGSSGVLGTRHVEEIAVNDAAHSRGSFRSGCRRFLAGHIRCVRSASNAVGSALTRSVRAVQNIRRVNRQERVYAEAPSERVCEVESTSVHIKWEAAQVINLYHRVKDDLTLVDHLLDELVESYLSSSRESQNNDDIDLMDQVYVLRNRMEDAESLLEERINTALHPSAAIEREGSGQGWIGMEKAATELQKINKEIYENRYIEKLLEILERVSPPVIEDSVIEGSVEELLTGVPVSISRSHSRNENLPEAQAVV